MITLNQERPGGCFLFGNGPAGRSRQVQVFMQQCTVEHYFQQAGITCFHSGSIEARRLKTDFHVLPQARGQTRVDSGRNPIEELFCGIPAAAGKNAATISERRLLNAPTVHQLHFVPAL